MSFFRSHQFESGLYWAVVAPALAKLWRRRTRSSLAALGTAIAVCGVVSITSIMAGMTESVRQTLSDLGSETVFVRSNSYKAWVLNQDVKHLDGSALSGINSQVSGITDAALFATVRLGDGATVRANGTEITLSTFSPIRIAAATSQLPYAIRRYPVIGRFLAETDAAATRPVCVISENLATQTKLAKPVGAVVEVAGHPFTVIGVMPSYKADSLGVNADIYIPFSTVNYVGASGRPDLVFSIVASEDRKKILTEVDAILWDTLRTPRGEVADFVFEDANEISAASSETITLISTVLLLVVSISLIVGGIGVMNVMLANVSERRQEIAIQRALGATEHHIKLQILMESCLLCLGGGIAGAAVGLCAAQAAPLFISKLELVLIPWWSVIAALLIASIVGILSGYIPAVRAARTDPIQVLNQR